MVKCMNISDCLIVKIDALDHQGRGIAHINSYVVFVFGALVEEVVEVQITKLKKNIIEAMIIRFLETSKDRVDSPCPYFYECGGCDLLHMCYLKQLSFKTDKVKEIVKKFAGIEPIIMDTVPSLNQFGYRNKVVFQVEHDIGFFRKKSNHLIAIDECLLLPKQVNQLLSSFHHMDLTYVNQIMIRCDLLGNMMILFDVSKCFSNSDLDQFSGYSLWVKKENHLELLSGEPSIVEQIGEYTFKISPNSFFQVNTKQMEKLYQIVLEYSELTGRENVLDLYCGTGTIGIFLSKKAKKVLGIEINQDAIEDAFWNQRQNHIENIDFICGDTGEVLKETSFDADLVVVDPPRAGLDVLAVLELKKINASKVIYVSCDPVTLARDIKRLEGIYEVQVIIPVDMFPNTSHVECVCVLNRR